MMPQFLIKRRQVDKVGKSITDGVESTLSSMRFLQTAFKYDLVNYSALARLIKPVVQEKTGANTSLDALIMAIRRHALTFKKIEKADIYKMMSKSSVELLTDMFWINYRRSDDLYKKLLECEEKINWQSGEKMYIVQRSNEISVISVSKYANKLSALVDETQIFEKQGDTALITVELPPASHYTNGLWVFFANQFDEISVNVLSIFSSYTKISFLIDEKDTAVAYHKISNAIKESSRLAKMKGN